jgi:CDP-glucose 4,6-dehydratase
VEELVSRRGLPDPAFWANRRVFLTGHTGFKGAWTALWLGRLGAEIYGFALPPETEPSLWPQIGDGLLAGETLADIGDREALRDAVKKARPHIVLHMAAQALVTRSYLDPVGTVATNVLGTANLLDVLREAEELQAVAIVTTDKVYANNGCGRDYVEDDPLGGHDPYSASKAAAELMTRSFAASYFEPAGIPVATARAGNVIGGGDWSPDRLAPNLWRAAQEGVPLLLRSPTATRPWQHVLEPLGGYFTYVEALLRDPDVPRSLNFGPNPGEPVTVAEMAVALGSALGVGGDWKLDERQHPPETYLLSVNPARAKESLGWTQRLMTRQAVEWTARWYAAHDKGARALDLCLEQIEAYEALP